MHATISQQHSLDAHWQSRCFRRLGLVVLFCFFFFFSGEAVPVWHLSAWPLLLAGRAADAVHSEQELKENKAA